MSKSRGVLGPSEAFSVLWLKADRLFSPMLAETSHMSPLAISPRSPTTPEKSLRVAPNCGVKPSGSILANEKQPLSARTASRKDSRLSAVESMSPYFAAQPSPPTRNLLAEVL